jgi:hypothetical protein
MLTCSALFSTLNPSTLFTSIRQVPPVCHHWTVDLIAFHSHACHSNDSSLLLFFRPCNGKDESSSANSSPGSAAGTAAALTAPLAPCFGCVPCKLRVLARCVCVCDCLWSHAVCAYSLFRQQLAGRASYLHSHCTRHRFQGRSAGTQRENCLVFSRSPYREAS